MQGTLLVFSLQQQIHKDLKTSVQNIGGAVDFQQQRQKQHGCLLSGPSSESMRTMHSLSSVHDLSVFNAEPGSAVVLCSTERLVLEGCGGGVSLEAVPPL